VKYKVATGVAELPGALTIASQHDVIAPNANAVARNAVVGSEIQMFAKKKQSTGCQKSLRAFCSEQH